MKKKLIRINFLILKKFVSISNLILNLILLLIVLEHVKLILKFAQFQRGDRTY